MALSSTQISTILYKKLRGTGQTSDSRQFFEEPYLGRQAILPSQVWNQASLIPNTAPTLADGVVAGVVTKIVGRSMTAVAGTTNAFYLAALINTIPFNYGDGTSYNYGLTDSTGAAIAFGQGDWILDPDAGLVTFEGTVPANMPPKITAYQYVGTFGVGSGAGGGGGNSNANPNGAAGVSDWTPVSEQIQGAVVGSFLTLNGYGGTWNQPTGTPGQFITTGTLPTPLAVNTTYYLISNGTLITGVSATPGGAAISITAAGTGSFYFVSSRPGSTNTSFIGASQGLFTISAKTPAGSGFNIAKGTLASTYGMQLEKPLTLGSPWDLLHPLVVGFDYDSTITNGLQSGQITAWVQELSTGNVVQLTGINFLASTKGSTQYQLANPSSYFSTVALKLILRWNTTSSTLQTFDVGNISYQSLYSIPVAVLQTISNSYSRVTGDSGFGTTGTSIRRWTNIEGSLGSDIVYVDSPTNGGSWTVQTTDVYSISYQCFFTTGRFYGISRNQANLAVLPSDAATMLAASVTSAAYPGTVNWQGVLNAGDVIRATADASVAASGTEQSFTIVKQGSIKAINAVLNQTMNLPTSTLEFRSASARGSSATFVIKYDNTTKLVGDAFTYTNDPVNGTVVTMNRAGRLSMNASTLYNGSNTTYLSRNQAVLTGSPTASEVLAWQGSVNSSSNITACSWTGDVAKGDVLRVINDTGVGAMASNLWNLAFFDTAIAVALNTVQPQWSQSNSESRVYGGNGYGSTNTRIRRFSNVDANTGSDITYLPSATNGDSWVVNTTDKYEITYVDAFSARQYFQITRNQAVLTAISTSGTETLAATVTGDVSFFGTITWSGVLNQGDIIRACAEANGGTDARISFTIAKSAKSNLLPLDVSQFVQYNQTLSDEVRLNTTNGYGSTATKVVRFSGINANSSNGVMAYSDDAVNGTKFTALKTCRVTATWSAQNGATQQDYSWGINGDPTVAPGSLPVTNRLGDITCPANLVGQASCELVMQPGDVLRAITSGSALGSVVALGSLNLLATADASAIQGPTNLTSSDTMSFAFKSTAIATTDPIGTFNTYTYASGGNTPTICTSAPTQTTASMNANGFQITPRAYNTLSTSATPARVDVFIGTGLKAVTVNAYAAVAKTTPFFTDMTNNTGTATFGTRNQYNEATGILTIEAAVTVNGAETQRFCGQDSSGNNIAAGYFVINAGKLPAIASILTVNAQKLYNAPYASAVAFRADYAGNRLLLTGAVTSSTIPSGYDGQVMSFIFVQDATGSRAFVWPTNVVGGMTIGVTASKRSQQAFTYSANDGLWVAQSVGVVNV